jgi:hypothetical protein
MTAPSVGLELEQLAGHGVGEAVDLGDAVADLDDSTDVEHVELGGVLLDLLLDDGGDLFGPDLHGVSRGRVGVVGVVSSRRRCRTARG